MAAASSAGHSRAACGAASHRPANTNWGVIGLLFSGVANAIATVAQTIEIASFFAALLFVLGGGASFLGGKPAVLQSLDVYVGTPGTVGGYTRGFLL